MCSICGLAQVLATSRGFLLLKAQLRHLTLFSDVISKLRRSFLIDALTDWTLCYKQSLILHSVTKGLVVNSILHNILEPVSSRHPVLSSH